ncbi:hypothetical protein HK100_009419 [Physocladia obscura]|uniref:Uncharacterized protein n=1 Tax=Physocladia obscura TaxID=109957 RepID=A0AAD5T5X4_9FUNG|nr:hypothetical protein HK100_009419 [Physocladia obscura]
MPVVVQYAFSPYLNPASTLSLSTASNQPILITSKVFQIYERHGLSSWNANVTSVGAAFNKGGSGLLEYYSSGNWLPLPLTQNIPYEWIDIQALRYNPNSFVGTISLILQVGTTRGYSLTPWLDSITSLQTLQGTITIKTTSNTNSSSVVAVAKPPDAGLTCYTSYPTIFAPTAATPIGPYCMSFSTVAGQSITATVSDFLSASLTLTTNVNAVVYFGTSVQPSTDYIPSGMILLPFAGFLDYSAFYIYITPSTAQIVTNSLTFLTPEVTYAEAQAGLTAGQITGIAFDPVAKTSSQFFPTSVNLQGPPQITTALTTSNVGMFFFALGSSSNGTTTRSVPYGTVTFIASWLTRDFQFPIANHGYLVARISSNVNVRVTIYSKCSIIWVPGGAGKFDCFTISYSTSSASTVAMTIELQYFWNTPISADYNAVNSDTIQWANSTNSLDGGNWMYAPSILNLANGSVSITITQAQMGQWAVLGFANGDSKVQFSVGLYWKSIGKMAMVEPTEGVGVPFTEGPKIEILKGDYDDPTAVTFVLKDEDHTIGNSLRYLLMKKLDCIIYLLRYFI